MLLICRKHDILLVQIGNAYGTIVFFDMLASLTVDTKGSRSILTKTAGHEKQNNCDVFEF
jgi:hypothetical protein